MMSTQEPNTIAPQSALCICFRKWKAKLIVPIYFGTKTSKFCLRIIYFSSLESELKGLGHAILGNFSTDQMVIELTKI